MSRNVQRLITSRGAISGAYALTGVALVPGAAFGDDRWVRLSYAAATSDLTRALDRIVEFAKKLGD